MSLSVAFQNNRTKNEEREGAGWVRLGGVMWCGVVLLLQAVGVWDKRSEKLDHVRGQQRQRAA